MKHFIFAAFIFLGLGLSADANCLEEEYTEPPKHFEPWYFVGNILDLQEDAQDALRFQAEGDNEKSRESMRMAIVTAPRNFGVRLAAAQWCLVREQIRGAQEQARATLLLEPGSPDAHFARGIVAMYEKDYVTAEKHFRRIHDKFPENIVAIHYLALALCEQDDPEKLAEAEEYAQRNIRVENAPPEVFAAAAWVQFKKGDIAAAEDFLQATVHATDGEVSSDIKYYIAAVKVKSDDPDAKNQANKLLTEIQENKTPFYMRKDAEKLQRELW